MSLPKSYYQEPGITIYHGNCRDILPHLEPVDLVLTDPPFGIGNFVQITGNIRGDKVDWNDSPPSAHTIDLVKKSGKDWIIWGANYFNCFSPDGGAKSLSLEKMSFEKRWTK